MHRERLPLLHVVEERDGERRSLLLVPMILAGEISNPSLRLSPRSSVRGERGKLAMRLPRLPSQPAGLGGFEPLHF
jgi:hypothetical protein